MGISRCVLFIDTPMGAIEAETEQERESPGIKITLRDEGKEPEIRVQYNPDKKAVEVLLTEQEGEKSVLLHTLTKGQQSREK